jgi:transposase
MIHLGIDLHKQFSFITAMDQEGNVLTKSKVSNQRESFLEFLSSYPPSKSQIVLEATWNWYWLGDLLEEQGYRLQMAHPLKTRAIASARIKTDKIDSEILAHLSRSNLVPQSYVVDRETRFRRELIRYRASLVRLRATIWVASPQIKETCLLISYNFETVSLPMFVTQILAPSKAMPVG